MWETSTQLSHNQWFPVAFAASLAGAPVSRQIGDTEIVLWAVGGEGRAALNACPHRDGPLSSGRLGGEHLICPYHGWAFDQQGACVRIPQQAIGERIPSGAHLQMLPTQERYGILWVTLGTGPTGPVPTIPEWSDPAWRMIPLFDEVWNCSAAALADHDLDCSHMSETHGASFADRDQPCLDGVDVQRTDYGLVAKGSGSVTSRHGDPSPNVRWNVMELWAPFTTVTRVTYLDAVSHLTFRGIVPLSGQRCRIVQFMLRNDTEEACSTQDVLEFERAAADEDKTLLEAISVPYSHDLRDNVHVRTDRPTIAAKRLWAEMSGGRWAPATDAAWCPVAGFHSSSLAAPDGASV